MYNDDLGFNPFKSLKNKFGGKKKRISRPSITSSPMAVGAKRTAQSFGAVTFGPALTTANLVAMPQVPFRLDRLVIVTQPNAAWIAAPAQILVNDLRVGNKSQFAGGGNLPVEAFIPQAIGASLRGDTAQPGVQLILDLQTSATPGVGCACICTAMVYGDSVF